MVMCSGFGRRRGECLNEVTVTHTAKTGVGLCNACWSEYNRTKSAAAQATAQREADLEAGLVTVWE